MKFQLVMLTKQSSNFTLSPDESDAIHMIIEGMRMTFPNAIIARAVYPPVSWPK